MPRVAFVTILILAGVSLWAQEARNQPEQPSAHSDQTGESALPKPRTAVTLPEATESTVSPGPPQRPSDLDILTGKADRESSAASPTYGSPYFYPPNGVYGYRDGWHRHGPLFLGGFRFRRGPRVFRLPRGFFFRF